MQRYNANRSTTTTFYFIYAHIFYLNLALNSAAPRCCLMAAFDFQQIMSEKKTDEGHFKQMSKPPDKSAYWKTNLFIIQNICCGYSKESSE